MSYPISDMHHRKKTKLNNQGRFWWLNGLVAESKFRRIKPVWLQQRPVNENDYLIPKILACTAWLLRLFIRNGREKKS